MSVHHKFRRFPRLAVRTAVIVWMGFGVAQPAGAGDDVVVVRVRSTNVSLASLIDRAAEQSTTFRGLLATIDRSNGIVHVEAGTCGHGVRACLKMWMGTAGDYRLLRVIIDRRKSDSDSDVMATTGHELQHAIEALSETGNVNGIRLFYFFRQFALTAGDRFETTAAIRAGDSVRSELR